MAKMPKSWAGRAGPGPGAGLGPARLQVWAPGAAPGPAHPPGRGPGPGRIPLWRPKDTLLIWPDFVKYFPALRLGTRSSPLFFLLAGPGPGRSPQARAQPTRQGLAPARPGPGQNTKIAQGAGK